MNKFPAWKYWLLIILFVVGLLYALPNVFGQDPSIQISSKTAGVTLKQSDLSQVKQLLKQDDIAYKSIELQDKSILIRFNSIDSQQKAQEQFKKQIGDQYMIAISLASAAPEWLGSVGAETMRLGLDLRGGVHFLLQVDVKSVIQRRLKSDVRNVAETLRDKNIRYSGINLTKKQHIQVHFRSQDTLNKALGVLDSQYQSFKWQQTDKQLTIAGKFTQQAYHKASEYTVKQTIETLKRRVNELGVSEATVQQQGANRIAIDLPGVQNATQAKNILGKTATLEFHLVDTKHDAMTAAQGVAPPGSSLYSYQGRPILLKDQVLLRGNAITSASSGFDRNGQPSVNIRISGEGESNFYHVTGENIGKPMAVVYIEVKSHPVTINGKQQIVYKKQKRVINIATIQSALSSPFQIMGLSNTTEAKNLSLLLRAGALIAPVTIIAEQNVGPSMGAQNIHLGLISILVGFSLVVLFMAFYYRLMGVIADIALFLNLVFIVAVMSLLGAVLSFPGIAAMVLTVGMAVDANVLIFERIREELRHGVAVQAAIHAGYEKAFTTIVDANVTTLIVAVVLFSLGTQQLKGFAITLTIGLLTSMVTSITYTRGLVNLIYGGRKVKHLSIGIKPKQTGAANNPANKEGKQ